MPKKGRDEKGKFVEGNQISVGNDGGRPTIYDDPHILEAKVVEYFDWCQGEFEEREGERRTVTGKGEDKVETFETYTYIFCVRNPEIPTITGLALFLGFSSKSTLYEYTKQPEFSDSIKRGLLRIEKNYEAGLWSDKPTGVIFALKNMGWVDKKELDHTTKGESLNIIQLGQGIKPHTDESPD